MYSFVYSQPVETEGDRLTGSSARGILSDLTLESIENVVERVLPVIVVLVVL